MKQSNENYLEQLNERMHVCVSGIKALLSHDDDPDQSETELKGQGEYTYPTVVGSDGHVLQIVPSEVH